MDRERCIQILEDRGVGPRIRLLIKRFWALALLVCKAGGYFGTAFKALRGVTQGGQGPESLDKEADSGSYPSVFQDLEAGLPIHGVKSLA